MDLTLHCKLCDHKIIDFKTGTLCGLTNRKPDFKNKCSVIKIQDDFKEQIETVNIEHDAILKTKTDTYGHLIMYVLLAIALVLAAFLLGKFILDKGFISTIPIIIVTLGFSVLGVALAPLNAYNSNLKRAERNKEALDTIGNMYGYKYDIDITHLKDSLGNKSYETDLKIRKSNNSL
ncbi:MAG: hypothetical protein ACJAZK_000644 [Psychroserpens sp.]|jgi:hypothetical protein|uniref:hypothetical protein n=1 Tax=Psychroserpens sp. TaxID=2020870 RepID=UPI0039E4162C